MAWSGGEEYSQISLYQYLGQILGGDCDVDVGFGGNFGQWVPAAPTLVGPGNTTSPGPAVTGTSQTFNWNAVSTATSYQLELKDVTAGTGTVTYPVSGGSTTSDTVSGLSAGHTYQWNMYALNGTVSSSLSTTNYFTIQASLPPATPTGLGDIADGRADHLGQLEHGKRGHQLHLGPRHLVGRVVDPGLLRRGGAVRG